MNTIIDIVVIVGIAALSLAVTSVVASVKADRTAALSKQLEEDDRQACLDKLQNLYQSDSVMHCLACGDAFPGPLMRNIGCPKCGQRTLIVSDDEFRAIDTPNAG